MSWVFGASSRAVLGGFGAAALWCHAGCSLGSLGGRSLELEHLLLPQFPSTLQKTA